MYLCHIQSSDSSQPPGILDPRSGMEPAPRALEAQSLYHWDFTSPFLFKRCFLGISGSSTFHLLQVWLETSASPSSPLSSLLPTSHHLPGLLILPRKFPHPCFRFPSLRVLFSLSSTQVDSLSTGPLLSRLSLFQIISHFRFLC